METYIISNIPPSKKNSKRIVCRGNRPLLLPSESYVKWHAEAMGELKPQIKGEKIIKCEKIKIEFWHKYQRKWDLDNKASTIFDALVDVGILEDDNWSVVPHLELIYVQAKVNKTLIFIT